MGIPIAEQPTGIDVSHWQGAIDWPTVQRSGRSFAYIKATEGIGYVNPNYRPDTLACRRVGMIPGAYHFLSHAPASTGATGAEQARFFFRIIKNDLVANTLPPALDIEADPQYPTPDSIQHMTARVVQFVDTLHDLIGVYPVIYGDRYFLTHDVFTTYLWDKCPLWIAHWGVDVPQLKSGGITLPWPYHTFHQYEARPGFAASHVPGVVGACDVDRFNGSMSQLEKLANTLGGVR